MADPFIGEIRPFSFNFPPRSWAFCDGQLLPINQNQALFSLLGTTYGGNGQTTFALPDLRGRVAVGKGETNSLGERAGDEAITLTLGALPQHTHTVRAAGVADSTSPSAKLPAPHGGHTFYGDPTGEVKPGDSVTLTGGSQAHNNMQPYICINFSIALSGIFPSQN